MQFDAQPLSRPGSVSASRDSRSGQILIVFVIAFTLVAGAVAMMLDGGRVYWEKRMAQNAADSAAMAGGHELRRGSTRVKAWVHG